EKGWKGAELIFDLDADHLPGATGMSYEQILDEVKRHTLRLVFTFLIGMLGINEESIKLIFPEEGDIMFMSRMRGFIRLIQIQEGRYQTSCAEKVYPCQQF
ncbi:DNA primase small subunit, partial [mine drainage metagenome]